MTISIRCQVCGQKLRVPPDFAGKRARCKCGTLIDDACEVMCVWSPLFAQLQAKDDHPITAGYRHPLLIVVASFLAVFGTGLGLGWVLSPAPDTNKEPAPPPVVIPPVVGSPNGTPPVVVPPVVPPPLVHAPKSIEKIQIVDWYVARSFKVVGVSNESQPPLELSEDAEKAGFVLVAVNVRLRSEAIAGKKFIVQNDVQNSDTKLITPADMDNSIRGAVGYSAAKDLWFAPSEGQYPYPLAKDEFVVLGWVFPVPRAHLETGRTLFQFGNEPAVPLTLEARRKKTP